MRRTDALHRRKVFCAPGLPVVGMRKVAGGLKHTDLAIYSTPYLATVMIATPLPLLQSIYAKHYGLALGAIALVVLVSRIFDALLDPIVGVISDIWFEKRGTRKPIIAAGAVTMVVAALCLFRPPTSVGLSYFAIWFIVLYIGWSLLDTPYMAWGSDISSTSQIKTKLFSFRAAAAKLGILAFYAIPLTPFFDTREITPQTLGIAAVVFAFILIVGLTLMFLRLPEPLVEGKMKEASGQSLCIRIGEIAEALYRNRPFIVVASCYSAVSLGGGMYLGMLFLYVDVFLHRGAIFAELQLMSVLVGLATVPVWGGIVNVVGKRRAWWGAMTLMAGPCVLLGMLSPFNAAYFSLVIVKLSYAVGFVGVAICGPALMSEVADYGHLKFKRAQTGTYFSFLLFSSKTLMAVGMSAGLAIAALCGFDATASEQSARGALGLRIAASWLPIMLFGISALLIACSPLDERRHAAIRQRLDRQRPAKTG